MGILNELSSQVGDRSEYSNRKVVLQILDEPGLLEDIVAALNSRDPALLGDCTEVLTMVADDQPEWIAPHAKAIAGLLTHKTTRVRWEAMHALSLIASFAPRMMAGLLPELGEMIRCDTSVIVRDYAVQAIGNYALTSPKAAHAAFSYLKQALTAWDGKQAGHALNGLAKAAAANPKLAKQANEIARRFADHPRRVVRKAAKALDKATRGH